MPKHITRKSNPKYTIHMYSAIRIHDEDILEKLFECIPDRWFVDESKSSCYWPPSTGKSVRLRAINCEKPDDSWNIYGCTVVSEGHLTYQSGFKIVQEKCSQKYNTSSADEYITATAYRREHPVFALVQQDNGNIEHIFGKSNKTEKQKQQKHKGIASSSEYRMPLPNGNSAECSIDEDTRMSTPQTIESTVENSLKSVPIVDGPTPTPENASNVIKASMTGAPTLSPLRSRPSVSCYNELSPNCRSSPNGSHSSKRSHLSASKFPQPSHSSSKRDSRSRSVDSIRSTNRTLSVAKNSKMLKHSRSGDMSRRSRRRSTSSSSRNSSVSSSKRSHSSRSISNVSQRGRVHSKRVSLSRSPSGESRSTNRTAKNSKMLKHTKIQNDLSLKTDLTKVDNRSKKTVKSNTERSKLNVKCQPAKSRQSRRSPSNSSGSNSKSRSRSRSHYSARTKSLAERFLDGRKMRRHSTRSDHESNRSRSNSSGSTSKSCSRSRSHYSVRTEAHQEKSLAERSLDERKKRRHSSSSRSDHESKRSRIRNDIFSRRLSKSYHESHKNSNSYRQQNTFDTQSPNKSCSIGDATIRDLTKMAKTMSETIERNHEQLKCYDRRLNRMEVTVNKILVLVGDLNGHGEVPQDEHLNDRGFEVPDLPISSSRELARMKKKLENKEFVAFFLQHEKEFCCPTKNASDTSTISKYLKRFVSLRVRSKLTLKENGEGDTLYEDYHKVYLFLINVIQAGYRIAKKSITSDEAHTALRIVWGRSKQQYREAKPKRK